jgi:hypothetical protein
MPWSVYPVLGYFLSLNHFFSSFVRRTSEETDSFCAYLLIANKPLALGSSTQGREPLVTIKEYNPPSEKANIGEDEEEEAV